MSKEFRQTVWDERLDEDLRAILALAIREDLGMLGDWTTRALVAEDAVGRAAIVARQPGVVAGLSGVAATLAAVDPRLRWSPQTEDGKSVAKGDCVGTIEGPARGLLVAERTVLNLLGRLSGIATLARRYVEAVAGTKARIYDTRKTTPGWRRLEKYAVRCGGGWNHRGGLDEAVLIKDNHLAIVAPRNTSPKRKQGTASQDPCLRVGLVSNPDTSGMSPAEAVLRARQFVARQAGDPAMVIEVEVDTLEQLDAVLRAAPDIVLLDNMPPAQLREAVIRRDSVAPAIELEASGGVNLSTVRSIAESGVERISVGALTHSAVSLDFGLDWGT
jgi:nicotinate-nucleotide pyrophosphorylase (carboxylating)